MAHRKSGWRWTERWSWVATIIAVLVALVTLLLMLNGGKIVKEQNPKNQQQVTTNISSFNQSGGTTPHTINIGPGERTLNESLKRQINTAVAGKKKVTILAVWGDTEAFQFATEIYNYLKGEGVPVYGGGAVQATFNRPLTGQIWKQLPNDEVEIFIGSHE